MSAQKPVSWEDLESRAAVLLESFRSAGLKIATAESCTGGLIAAVLTSVAGSSDVFERGFVTYTNEAKSACLGVPPDLFKTKGAVSMEVAAAMAEGTIRHSLADVSVSVTGVAGPGGGSVGKPVGLVYFGCARRDGATTTRQMQFGDIGRTQVRLASVAIALQLVDGQIS